VPNVNGHDPEALHKAIEAAKLVTDKEVDGFSADCTVKDVLEALVMIQENQDLAKEVDVVKFAAVEEIGIASMIRIAGVDDGDRQIAGSFSEDFGGLTEESFLSIAVVPDTLFDGDFFSHSQVTLFQEL